jgi:hypothetical protein
MERGTRVFASEGVGNLLHLVCTKFLQIRCRRTLRELAHAARYIATGSYRESRQNLAIRSARSPFGRKLVSLLLCRCALVRRQVRIIGGFLRGIRFLCTVADKRSSEYPVSSIHLSLDKQCVLVHIHLHVRVETIHSCPTRFRRHIESIGPANHVLAT